MTEQSPTQPLTEDATVVYLPPREVIPHPYSQLRPHSLTLSHELTNLLVSHAHKVTYFEAVGVVHELLRFLPAFYGLTETNEESNE